MTADNHSLGLPASKPLRRRCRAALFALAVVLAAAGADSPAPPDKPAEKPDDKSGKLTLFDGKSLDGWKRTNFGGEGDVEVEDGMIVMRRGALMTGITSTRKDLPLTNYQLSYEAMRLEGSDFFAAATFPVGKSHLTLVNGGWGGSVTGLSSLDGYDAAENETGNYFKYQDKQWYKFRILVTDKTVQCWIDDKKFIDVSIEGRKIGTRIEVDPSKPLGFAAWESAGALRNIQIDRLTPEQIKKTDEAEAPK